jgi:hypothetical protein
MHSNMDHGGQVLESKEPHVHGGAGLTPGHLLVCIVAVVAVFVVAAYSQTRIGDERAIPRHLRDGEEFEVSARELIAHGRQLFTAMWTVEDGAGRARASLEASVVLISATQCVGQECSTRILRRR